MKLTDLLSTESAIAAAATAVVFSPRTRGTLRRGAVLGVAGALKAGDVVVGAARGIARGMSASGAVDADAAANPGEDEQDTTVAPQTEQGAGAGASSTAARGSRSRARQSGGSPSNPTRSEDDQETR